MVEKDFELNEQTLSLIESIGKFMPGGFFIYKREHAGRLLYANPKVFDIYGCQNEEEFREWTGYTFERMVHPDDRKETFDNIVRQIEADEDKFECVEYRIIRRDGKVRWLENHGHYIDTRVFGGIYVVLVSDITDRRMKMEIDTATKDAVLSTLTNTYNTVWLINDVQTESCSLYHSDEDASHKKAIRNALGHNKYTDTKTEYVNTMVAEEDRERMQEEISLPHILKMFETKYKFSVNFIRDFDGDKRHYRIDFGKVYMPEGHIGVTMGFKDVDEEVRQGRAVREALEEAKKAEEENLKLVEEVQSAAKLADLMGSVSSLLTNMPAMSFSKDIETGKYLACNQAFAEYAGKTKPEEVVGLTDYEIFDRETAEHFVEDDQKAIDMEDAYVFFEDVPDATGQVIRNLQTTKSKFRDSNGRLCLLGMCVDVTEMARVKTAEAKAQAKQQELEEKIKLQEQ